MKLVTVGYYDGRNNAAVWVPKGDIRAVFDNRLERIRMEALEDAIILTDPRDQQWRYRDT